MAAVVVQKATAPYFGKPLVNVNGSWREYYYAFALAADADWLDVPMRTVADVKLNDDGVSAIGVASIARQGYGSRITFNSGGALTGVLCRVTGH
jgi:hypothetical protein